MKRGCVSHFGSLITEASNNCSQTLNLEVGSQGPAWAPGHGAVLSEVAVQAIAGPGAHQRALCFGLQKQTEASVTAPLCTEMKVRDTDVLHRHGGVCRAELLA